VFTFTFYHTLAFWVAGGELLAPLLYLRVFVVMKIYYKTQRHRNLALTLAARSAKVMPMTDILRTTYTGLVALLGPLFLSQCSEPPPNPPPQGYTFKLVASYPHDAKAFTQGLCYEDGFLYEGTGRYGESTLRKVALATGEVLQSHALDAAYFGEGIAIVGDRIVQLTWRTKIGFVYDKATFGLLDNFNYNTEGWGITYDGSRLIMSDGSSKLHFLDPTTFEETGTLRVMDHGLPVTQLNELEYVEGEIYANVWKTDRIARITPATGEVVGWIDLKDLAAEVRAEAPMDVLNGIAYDASAKRLFITGKLWPKIYEFEMIPIE